MHHLLRILPLWIGVAGALGSEPTIRFNRDIRPILSENCFYCHGFDQKHRKAGLRLDVREGALETRQGQAAIVPGQPDLSLLLDRIHSTDDGERMPPPETLQELTPDQKRLLRRWIQEGAPYEEHWAWRSLARPSVPENAKGSAAIDAFLELSWKENGLQPSPLASPRELLRRLSFDLRGLPPSSADLERFMKDPSPEQLASLRNRWMQETAFAEHQSVTWLDLVRWADTSGLVSDEPIASGAYRAWVVQAIRDNVPFDQFSISQLAGDLLEHPTDADLVASGYNRILNTNCEAGAIEEEQLYKLKGEHVRALGTVWLGLTTGCAECHDHKFDPFSARDYYSLAAFFDDLVEAGVYTPGDRREPLHYLHDSDLARQRDQQLTRKIEEIQGAMQSLPLAPFKDWEAGQLARLKDSQTRRDFVWIPAQLPAPRILEGTFGMDSDSNREWRETEAATGTWNRHHAAEFMTGYVHQKAQVTQKEKDAWFAEAWMDPTHPPTLIAIQISQGDYGRLGWKTANYETYYWGEDTLGILSGEHPWSSPKRARRMGDLPKPGEWTRLRVPMDSLVPPESGQAFEAVGMAWIHTGGKVRWGNSGLELRGDKATALELGETAIRKWWETPYNRQTYQSRMEMMPKALKKPANERDALETEVLNQAFQEQARPDWLRQLRRLESERQILRARATPVLVSRASKAPRTTRLLNRGDYKDTSGPTVAPAFPSLLKTSRKSSVPPNRLDLARWLFQDGRDLVARVYVNRLWQRFYGRGLSETLEDAGTQGDWPSHPDLLDWLAMEFIDSGWDTHHMIRLLTSAQAYQLSSQPTPAQESLDPGNRWHARQSRFRLPAEVLRDTSLKVAGLLAATDTIPMESVFPYQPAPYWTRSDKVMYGSRHLDWDTSTGPTQYARSLYTFWKRQNIHPTFLALDAPTRQECTAQRNITNTPGQALALLNDPIFVEASRVLAESLLEEKVEGGDTERLQRAFSRTLQRAPSPGETRVLQNLLDQERQAYATRPQDAGKLRDSGFAPHPVNLEAREVAAWMSVTRTLLNLHEFLTRP